jgi:hypothetical protein
MFSVFFLYAVAQFQKGYATFRYFLVVHVNFVQLLDALKLIFLRMYRNSRILALAMLLVV